MPENPLLKQVVVPRERIPELALTLMLAGILVPTALYSFHLHAPTPAELLVAVSIALFSSVLFLWIMDATGILPFKSPWISKAVYGAAITSVLGTSVAVYKDFFDSNKYPFEGAWHVTVTDAKDPSHPSDFSLLLAYSKSADLYWGYSSLVASSTEPRALVWVEAIDVSPQDSTARLRLHFGNGEQKAIEWPLNVTKNQKHIRSATVINGFSLEMHRPT